MERDVVLSDGVRAVSVEPQRVLVVPDPVVEPPDFEGHVLGRRGKGGQTDRRLLLRSANSRRCFELLHIALSKAGCVGAPTRAL